MSNISVSQNHTGLGTLPNDLNGQLLRLLDAPDASHLGRACHAMMRIFRNPQVQNRMKQLQAGVNAIKGRFCVTSIGLPPAPLPNFQMDRIHCSINVDSKMRSVMSEKSGNICIGDNDSAKQGWEYHFFPNPYGVAPVNFVKRGRNSNEFFVSYKTTKNFSMAVIIDVAKRSIERTKSLDIIADSLALIKMSHEGIISIDKQGMRSEISLSQGVFYNHAELFLSSNPNELIVCAFEDGAQGRCRVELCSLEKLQVTNSIRVEKPQKIFQNKNRLLLCYPDGLEVFDSQTLERTKGVVLNESLLNFDSVAQFDENILFFSNSNKKCTVAVDFINGVFFDYDQFFPLTQKCASNGKLFGVAPNAIRQADFAVSPNELLEDVALLLKNNRFIKQFFLCLPKGVRQMIYGHFDAQYKPFIAQGEEGFDDVEARFIGSKDNVERIKAINAYLGRVSAISQTNQTSAGQE